MFVGIAGRFIHSLLWGLIQRSHIATGRRPQGSDQVSKRGQRFNGNQRGAEREVHGSPAGTSRWAESKSSHPEVRRRYVHRGDPSSACEYAMSDGIADASGSKPLPSRNDVHYVAGSTGIGKTFLARAFGQKACRDGFTAYFATAAQLFRELELGRADGSYAKKLRALGQVDVLIVDDWAMAPLAEAERRAFLEICDERYLTRSTLLTSQLPVAKWHAQIGDPTVADSILDRLVHGAHRIELQGDSIRKLKGRNGKKGE